MAKKTTIENSPEGLDHDDDFDGVKELNNPAPNWIILVFLATIGFSLIYAIHYFGYPGNAKDQASEYAQSITAADKANAAKPSAGGAASQNESEMLASGATLFTQKGCIACHGVKGEGNHIGTDLIASRQRCAACTETRTAIIHTACCKTYQFLADRRRHSSAGQRVVRVRELQTIRRKARVGRCIGGQLLILLW